MVISERMECMGFFPAGINRTVSALCLQIDHSWLSMEGLLSFLPCYCWTFGSKISSVFLQSFHSWSLAARSWACLCSAEVNSLYKKCRQIVNSNRKIHLLERSISYKQAFAYLTPKHANFLPKLDTAKHCWLPPSYYPPALIWGYNQRLMNPSGSKQFINICRCGFHNRKTMQTNLMARVYWYRKKWPPRSQITCIYKQSICECLKT